MRYSRAKTPRGTAGNLRRFQHPAGPVALVVVAVVLHLVTGMALLSEPEQYREDKDHHGDQDDCGQHGDTHRSRSSSEEGGREAGVMLSVRA